MQIVIEIDDDDYQFIKDTEFENYVVTKHLYEAVYKGILLPKEHGMLIDESDLIPDADYENGIFYAVSIGAINGAPTIIEADVPDICVGKMAESEE